MKTTYTNEELDNILFNNGLSDLEMYYTGGGIYLFTGKLADKIYICGSSEGYAWFTDERPTADEISEIEWQEEHQIYEPTDSEATEWAYYFIANFIECDKENNENILEGSNYSIGELELILDGLREGETE